jgi:hypothetical protein
MWNRRQRQSSKLQWEDKWCHGGKQAQHSNRSLNNHKRLESMNWLGRDYNLAEWKWQDWVFVEVLIMERVAAGRNLLWLQQTCLQLHRGGEGESVYRGSNCMSRRHHMNTRGCSRSKCDNCSSWSDRDGWYSGNDIWQLLEIIEHHKTSKPALVIIVVLKWHLIK